MAANSCYVTLFGGPWDGRRESVLDGCMVLRLNPPMKFEARPIPDETIPPDEKIAVLQYVRSREDQSRFVFDENFS